MNRWSQTCWSCVSPRLNTQRHPRTVRAVRRYGRLVGGGVILAVLVWRVGSGPFLDGIHAIDGRSLAAAVGTGAITTACCAWRWRLVARGLGVEVELPRAIAAYYRSQFLNTTLPGGVLGDIERGVRHGRDVGDVGRNLRAVVWERGAGQAVQIVLTMLALLVFASPIQSNIPVVAILVPTGIVAALLLAAGLSRGTLSRPRRALSTAAVDIRDGLLARSAWPGITLASVLVVAGHTTMFLVAARAAGVTSALITLLPLALLALGAMVIPINIGGWGPREGVAAWAFAASGFGAAAGVTTAVVYGLLGFVATLPGAAVLVADQIPRRHGRSTGADPFRRRRREIVVPEARHRG